MGEIWLGSSENNGFVIIQKMNHLMIIISSLFLNLFYAILRKQTDLAI